MSSLSPFNKTYLLLENQKYYPILYKEKFFENLQFLNIDEDHKM